MIRILLLLAISFSALAAPSSIEVWILSNSKVTELNKLLDRSPYVYRAKTAELQCQQMGEYCFDPQFGLYKKDNLDASIDRSKVMEDKSPTIEYGRSVDRNLINCDKTNYFDVFCGKARALETKPVKSSPVKLDLWIDTSSSMKEFDFVDKEGGCYRKSLVKRLDQSCSFNQEVNVMMFDTSLKQAGTMDSVCQNQGLNEVKRLMDWIERSDAKQLVVITDIYELHKEFADFIESKNGIIKGDKDAITAADLLKLVDDLAKRCK